MKQYVLASAWDRPIILDRMRIAVASMDHRAKVKFAIRAAYDCFNCGGYTDDAYDVLLSLGLAREYLNGWSSATRRQRRVNPERFNDLAIRLSGHCSEFDSLWRSHLLIGNESAIMVAESRPEPERTDLLRDVLASEKASVLGKSIAREYLAD